MGKNRNRQRRQARAAKHEPGEVSREATAPVLRLVRSEDEHLPPEPPAAGFSGAGLTGILERERGDVGGRAPEGGRDVVAALDARPAGDIVDARPVKVARSFDAGEINRIINDPNVFPLVSVPGVDEIDVTPFVQDPRNILMMAEGGGALFIQDEPGLYEVHTNFLPEFRGRHAIEASLSAYQWMFTHTDCMSIATRIPAFNRPAAFAARKAGFEPRFARKALWPTPRGPVDLRFYEISYQRWIEIDAARLMQAGRAFHEHLDAERARHGVLGEQHPDEDCHDLYVGVCTQTIYGGQPEKAIVLYNRWARLAGYGQITMIARNPLVIDIGNALLQIGEHSFKAIKVSS